ncbi:glycine zipper domain-containing protein [Helicobacter vulpis]|uniref:glycine zipper domain-containing protein n=1 Tax=Helicobacter vulpis TaxID=2316076 RepID=UPI000EB4E3E3
MGNPTPKVPKTLAGFALGGFLGSMVPLVGTLVGAGIGAFVGGVMDLKEKKD